LREACDNASSARFSPRQGFSEVKQLRGACGHCSPVRERFRLERVACGSAHGRQNVFVGFDAFG
jgi:hypothetical protein